MSKELVRMDRREPDPYAVLQVSPNASIDVIRAAYRALARRAHPDVSGPELSAHQRMRELNAAYGMLSDPKRRADYDARRRATSRACAANDVRLVDRPFARVQPASVPHTANRRRLSRSAIVVISVVAVLCVSALTLMAISALLDALDEGAPGTLSGGPPIRVDSIRPLDYSPFEPSSGDLPPPRFAPYWRLAASGDDHP
jgi:curved DNA-binding protein CbpA